MLGRGRWIGASASFIPVLRGSLRVAVFGAPVSKKGVIMVGEGAQEGRSSQQNELA